ncbi:MAG: alpha/beta fold hydrolase, partial [Bradyrhizobium sp.]
MNAGEIAVAAAALDDVFSDDIVVPAADGYPLAATLFLPRAKKRHAVLINSATAVPRKVYRGFAGYLARRGAAVLTYDYRGTGDSRPMAATGLNKPKSLAGFKATMADWAALDATAAVRWMRERYRDLPFAYVGHSFGGQALGLLPNNAEIPRALLIASQAAHWKLVASPERYRVVAFMNGIGLPLAR